MTGILSHPRDMDNIIEAKEVQIGGSTLMWNSARTIGGRFLRITEEAHGRRNTIIVRAPGRTSSPRH